MDKRKGFTLIELLVVIAIVALLMSILMPALTRVRKQAKSAICQMNLHHWGAVFSMYTDDNDGFFMDRVFRDNVPLFGGHSWPSILLPYYRDPKLRFCPMATRSYSQGVPVRFVAWIGLDNVLNPDSEEYVPAGSYGLNDWILKTDIHAGFNNEVNNWKTTNVRGAHNIPVLMDSWWPAGFPDHTDEPPAFDGEVRWGDEMVRYCVNRHDLAVNSLFVDWSVRKVGLRQMWTLKWYRNFDFSKTLDPEDPSQWPEWMRHSKKYD